jgi:hypothetical protein
MVGSAGLVLGVASAAKRPSRPIAAADCPHPSIPVPPNEPVYRTGPTELVSGLYIQGGPVPPPPCKPKPRGPYAGTITVSSASTGMAVASQSVNNGHLAHIPLARGKYTVSGKFAGGGVTTFSATVRVRRGLKVRQDVFEDVP